MIKKHRTLINLSVAIALVIFVAIYWNRFVSPTRIAIVNFRDFQYAQMLDASDAASVRLDRITKEDLIDTDFTDYDVTLIFGMGLRLDDNQAAHLRDCMEHGARLLVQASTSEDNEYTNVTGDDRQALQDYLSNGGLKNLRRLFNYCRVRLDGKTLFTTAIEPAEEMPSDALFHLDKETFFTDVNSYQAYYQERGFYHADQPRVCVLTSIVGPSNSKRETLDGLITRLEDCNLNVYPIAGFRQRLDFMKAISPDLVIYFPHGRINMMGGDSDGAVAWLKERNIPLLCPINVHQPYDEWLNSQQGLSGGMLSQSIVMPELDGGIEPFTVGAEFEDERGLLASGPIESRLDTLVARVNNWLTLQRKPNADKKVAIVYFKGPGRNALVAAGLEVGESLLNVLRHLRDSGYTTGELPETVSEFEAMIQRQGPVLGPYAQGRFEEYLQEGDPELIRTEDYLDWVQEQLDPELYAQVEAAYGPAPGQYLSLTRDHQSYLALPRVQFGNVVLLPQLMPGLGDDTNQLVHGVKQAPPHSYIATYLWARHGFGADAIIHFGTHGSLEFTPWKQSALSQMDWPDALIGDLPHPYIYVINNIGEAVIAKRRSYATLVSYLTPPFMESDLYGPLSELQEAIEGTVHSQDEALRQEYAQSLPATVRALDLDKDLGFADINDRELTDAEIETLDDYLHHLAMEKVTRGAYVLGRPYTDDYARETAGLMAIEPVTSALICLQQVHGDADLSETQAHDLAAQIIEEILNGQITWQDIVRPGDLQRLEDWDEAHAPRSPRGPAAMKKAAPPAQSTTDKASPSQPTSDSDGPPHSIHCGCPACRAWVAAHANDAAKPAEPVVQEPTKEEVLQRRAWIEQACQPDYRQVLFATADATGFAQNCETWDLTRAQQGQTVLGFYAEHTDLAEEIAAQPGQDNQDLAALLRLGRGPIQRCLQRVEDRLDELEENEHTYVEAVRSLRDALQDVTGYQKQLLASTEAELGSLVRVLDGGYVTPSTGGDALRNPKAVPTGRNLTAINMDKTPTPESWKVGVKLAEDTIARKLAETGDYPHKVAVTLWGGELIRTEGTQLAMIFHFLGVEPVRNARGTVQGVKLVPMEKLQRPRIDVVVQTSGQARDIAASRLFLIDQAVRLASEARDTEGMPNFVQQGTLAAERVMQERGLSPLDARTLSTARVFGGVNGNYGTGIMGLVESGDRWEDDQELTDQYLKNMGALYIEGHWGDYTAGVFEAALQNTDTVVHSRSSNVWGPLSLDHAYEFMGGINAVVRNVTGNDPDALFSDLRNAQAPVMQGAKEAIWVESRTTLLNPKYIQALQAEGASSAETFAEAMRNTYAWNVLKPAAIDKELWEGFYDVYVQDSLNLDMETYFKEKNPYALQEISAVMLETIRKGYWQASDEVIQTLADLHTRLVRDHKAGCSGFVCDNAKLRDFIAQAAPPEQAKTYQEQIDQVRVGQRTEPVEGMKLEKKTTTLDQLKETVTRNLSTVLALLGLVVFLIVTVFIGKRRHQDS